MPFRKPASDHQSLDGRSRIESNAVTLPRQNVIAARALLNELHALLEDYGPTWYSEELNERIESVVASLDDEL